MTDLTTVLPGFPTQKYVRLLPSLEKNLITTADLLTLDCVEIARRAQLPVLDVKRLSSEVLETLKCTYGLLDENNLSKDNNGEKNIVLKKTGEDVFNAWDTISSLDDDLDKALGGGIPSGYITEVAGESGVGKTQFLLTLLLSVQLPAPMGLSSSALYISTESALPITRLSQLLRSHPVLANADLRPTLDRVFSIVTPDLESQDHILRYQVPVVIAKYGIRLIVLDSVAANYRAEFERPGAGNGQSGGANMAQRSFELVKLGQLLRDLAREHGLVVVVANQVADRFMGDSRNSPGGSFNPHPKTTNQSSALARRETVDTHGLLPNSSLLGSAASSSGTTGSAFKFTSDSMSLDHQQRWFTGWGDEQYPSYLAAKNQKTPSLGFIWTSQISCRIALIKRPVYGRTLISDEETERGEPVLRRWRRWMKVVFAPHTASSGPGVSRAIEFEIKGEGLTAVQKNDYTIDEDEN